MYVVDSVGRITYPSNFANNLWSGQTLKRGDRNDYVKTLQSWLYRAGFNPGGIDGVYGANTEKAVKEFQKKMGITADGIAGKQTYQALQKYVRTETTTSQSNSSNTNDQWTGQRLREGNRGQAVKDLQTKLQRLGYNIGTIDGVYGKQTTEAVRSFQKANGLEVDGIAGKITYNAIEHMLQQKNYYDKKTIIENKYRSLEAKVHSKNSTWDEVSESLKEIAKLGFDFIIGDDIKTLLDGNASTIDKLIASLSFIPGGKVVNEGVKLSKMGSKVLLRLDLQFFAREAVHSVIRSLPENPKDLLKRGWQDVTDPRMKANTKMREYKDPVTGLKVRFDPATPGASGYEGKDHYHIYNPNATGKNDMYLDINGKPVAKGSKASHIVINKGEK